MAGLLRTVAAVERRVHLGQQVGILIGLATQHHPIEDLQLLAAGVQGLNAAIQDELEIRKILHQLRGHVVAQRRDLAILLGRQPFEDGDARMHGEAAATGLGDLADEIPQGVVAVPPGDADAVLDRHRDGHGIAHRLDAVGHPLGIGHQAGADHVVLHPVAGAADVQVDLVIPRLLTQPRGGGKFGRHAAAQLQGQGMLGLVMTQESLGVAMQQGAGGDHLGIEQGVLG